MEALIFSGNQCSGLLGQWLRRKERSGGTIWRDDPGRRGRGEGPLVGPFSPACGCPSRAFILVLSALGLRACTKLGLRLLYKLAVLRQTSLTCPTSFHVLQRRVSGSTSHSPLEVSKFPACVTSQIGVPRGFLVREQC